MATYPFALTVTNGGFETGDNTGWTSYLGGLPSTGTDAANIQAGTYHFIASPDQEFVWWGQDVALPSTTHTDVDGGDIEARLTCWVNSAADDDRGMLFMQFLDASDNVLGHSWGNWLDPQSLSQALIIGRVPASTRTIRMGLRGYRVSGTELSFYGDEFELELRQNSLTHEVLFYDDCTSTTPWTQVTGTLNVSTDTGVFDDSSLNWSNSASGEAYRDTTVPSAWETDVDNGEAAVELHWLQSSFSTSDSGGIYIEFYDGTSNLLGSRQYAAEYIAREEGTARWHGPVPCPINTRTVRVGIVGTRNAGTNLDGNFNFIEVMIVGQEPRSLGSLVSSYDLTISSGAVGSDLTDFPVFVNLADMPSSFWSEVRQDGGNIRVRDNGNNLVPVDVIRVQLSAQKGSMYFKDTVPSGSDTTWTIEVYDKDTQPALPSAADGKWNVWSDYEEVIVPSDDGYRGRTGRRSFKDVLQNNPEPAHFELTATSPQLNAHQGVAWDGVFYYVCDTDTLTKFDASWNQQAQNATAASDAGVTNADHLGDPVYHDGNLYLPLEDFDSKTEFSLMRIAVYDASDLSFVTAYNIEGQGHEVATIAYNPDDGLLYIGSYNNDPHLYKYTLTGEYVGAFGLGELIDQVQGLTYVNRGFYISSDDIDGIRRCDEWGQIEKSGIPVADASGTVAEGLSHTDDGDILWCKFTSDFVNTFSPVVGETLDGGGRYYHRDELSESFYKVSGVNSSNTFSMGISAAQEDDGGGDNQGLCSYGDAASARVGLVVDNGDELGVFDFDNSWLYETPAFNPVNGTSYQTACVYVDSGDRKLYRDGQERNVDATNTYADGGTEWVVGDTEDPSSEPANGHTGFAYLRLEELSADWLQGQYDNMSDPATFYSIAASPGSGPTSGTRRIVIVNQ